MRLSDLFRRTRAGDETRTSHARDFLKALNLVIDPSDPDAVEEFLRLGAGGGVTSSGVSVSAGNATRVAAVYRCVALLADPIGYLPINLVRRSADGVLERDERHPLQRVLEERPNAWQTPFEFRSVMQERVLLRGNAYAQVIRNGSRVTDLIPLDPDKMEVEQRDDWSLRYIYKPKPGKTRVLRETDVLHVRHRPRDGVLGVSVLEHARESIGLAMSTERHGAVLFKNSARPSGVFKTPEKLGDEGFERLRAQLDDHTGSENAHRTMILEGGLEYSPMSMTAEDAQFVQTRQLSRTEIATFFGIPPFMLGDTEKSTSWGAGIEQQSLGFIRYTLQPHLVNWEQAFKRALLIGSTSLERGVGVRFDVSELARGDDNGRATYNAQALQWGWMSPNEVRRREGLKPRPDGEKFYPPPNMTADSGDGQAEESDA